MVDLLQKAWNDPVWSKVIAVCIVGLAGSLWASIKFKWWNRLTSPWEIRLTMTGAAVSFQAPGAAAPATYPLKYHVEMRNDSAKCVEVRVSHYIPKAITLKSFAHEVLQLRFHNNWFPVPLSTEAVGVLPRQLCRAWIGIDEKTFSDTQVKACVGQIGTLVVTANKKHFSFDL